LPTRNLLIYVDRASDNGPIQGAQIEVEGPGIKGVATAMADGVYQLPAAALAQAGKYPLTLTIQARGNRRSALRHSGGGRSPGGSVR
jgi:hypothetical protein